MSNDTTCENGIPVLVGSMFASAIPWGFLYFGVPMKRGVSFPERALTYLQSSREGLVIEVLSALFSAVSCGTYVAGTYLQDDAPSWFYTSELAMSMYFAVYWFNQFMIATNRIQYLFGMQSFVDIITAAPVIVATSLRVCEVQFGVFAAARVMKFFRVLRLIRVLRSFEMLSSSSDDAIRGQTMRLFSIVAVILVVTTGFVQYLANDLNEQWLGVVQSCLFPNLADCELSCGADAKESCVLVPEDDHSDGDGPRYRCWFSYPYRGTDATCTNAMQFHDSLYFTIVTFATVGYGDVVPVTTLSRISIFFMIGVTMWAVPQQLNKLQALKELKTEHDGVFSKTTNRPHVILSCSPSVNVEQFVHEFFHEDHAMKTLTAPQLVLLIDRDPSNDLRRLLLKYATRQRLFYVRGDATAAMDLGRARIDEAVAIFLMADRSCEDHDREDQITTLRAFTAKRSNPSIRIFAQVMQPENEPLVLSAGVNKPDVMCMNQMRLSLLGASVAVPGLPTLLLNLVQSISWRQSIMALDWHEEYSEGMTMEMYSFKLKRDLVGMRFGEMCRMLKDDANACLVAVASSDSMVVLDRLPSKRMLRAKSKKQMQAMKKSVVRRGSVSTHEKLSGVMFNPGKDYEIAETDTLFVVADEAKRLERYERFDETNLKNLNVVHPSDSSRSLGSALFGSRRRLVDTTTAATSQPEEAPAAPPGATVTPSSRRLLPDPVQAGAAREGGWQGDGGGQEREVSGVAASESSEADGEEWDGTSQEESESSFLHPESRRESEELFERRNGAAHADENSGVSRCENGDGNGHNGGERRPLGESARAVSGLTAASTAEGEELRPARDEESIRRAMNKLVDSVEETYGAVSVTAVDNLRAFVQFQLQELRAADRDVAASRRPLRDYLVHSVPPRVKGHVVVVCSTMDDMQYLIRPIYCAARGRAPPIVFITAEFPTAREWDEANMFQEVWVIINKDDSHKAMEQCLERAGLLRARSLLCCCNMSKLSRSSQDADAKVMQAVLVAHSLAEFHRDLILITELTKGGFTRKARGAGTTSQLVRHMVSQSLRHGKAELRKVPGIDLNTALDASMEASNLIQGFQHLEPAYVAGLTVMSSLLDLLVCQQYFNPHIITIMHHLLLGSKGSGNSPNDTDYIIVSRPVPPEFASRTFGELFLHMSTEEDTIALGLYRLIKSSAGNQHYVVTNPRKQLRLRPTDAVYLIGPQGRGSGS